MDVTIDGVYYFHGTGRRGKHAAYNASKEMRMSVVMGHTHSNAGVKLEANPHNRYFGMDTGCGIDQKAAAMEYGVHYK